MTWNYIGIDPDPPKTHKQQLLLLRLSDGSTIIGTRHHPHAIAWTSIPPVDTVKERCQVILRGLPELHMIVCVLGNPTARQELVTALAHYRDDNLAAFTDLVRALDRKAHNGTPCIANYHG